MNTKQITEYNKEALKNISKLIELSDREAEPVMQTITHSDFSSLCCSIKTIFDAIEIIGYNGNNTDDLATCAGLASIGGKLMPFELFEFLDGLIIEKTNYKGEKLELTPLNK